MVAPTAPALRLAGLGFVAAVTLFMLAPLAVVALSSFSASEFLVFPPRGLSLRWYGELFRSSDYIDAAWLSIRIAVVVTILSAAIGAPAAVALARHRVPAAEAISGFFLSPLIMPTLLIGIGLLMAFSRYGQGPSFASLVLGHLVVTLPYVVRTIAATLARADRFVEEAARVMGAPWWRRYWHVVLPQARPGLLAGMFFAFNVSFDETVVALFLHTPGTETLPLFIYDKLEFSPDPSVAAAASVMIGVTLALMLLIDRAVGLGRAAA
jgi:putative spermidine/putrescine transport system permease protein